MSNYNDVHINVDKRDATEVVYKPTTTTDIGDGAFNKSFQSLKPENETVPKSPLFLYVIAFTGDLLAFVAGVGFSWTSPVLPKLHGPDSPLSTSVDASQESIIAAILSVGAAIGPFVFGFLADKIGRKKTLLTVALPLVAGYAILAFTGSVKMYYLARLLCGMGNGGVFTVLTMYTGEITQEHNRGKFSCLIGLFVTFGLLYPFAIGPMLSVKLFCLSCLVPLTVFLVLFTVFSPETPGFLIMNDDVDEAENALAKLRGKSKKEVRAEMQEIQKLIESQRHDKGGLVVLFRTNGTRRAFVVGAGLLIIQQVSGINAVTGFLESIFAATGSSISPQIATTLIGSIQVVTVFVTSSVIEKLGRKVLLLLSTVGSAVSIIFLGLYFHLRKHEFSLLAYFWWLPIVCLLLYIVSFNLGIGPVPWTVLSEIFPSNVKSSATALASATCFSTSFVVTMAFPLLSEMIGMAQCFWLFGLCCVLGIIFIYFVVPETKGKTVTEIQQILSK
ncbi:hypothetical protein GWI33_016362 [Rhynchophorus ferrugineus]|uniref:Major facilitator superfamily (MFS) profile domain-containing protein n=1 Tax=Rhynchophorus ferrugineus TaxID=354439 RepID=A0A834I090_RHYFE|nr:hypothetical protein GWI33_016362 [Rhynchophorus ferrugineus]